MKLSFSLAALALGVSTVLAQEVIVSNPFNLVVISKNATWNGTYLSSCHEGAGIEALCPYKTTLGTASIYTFNQTVYPGNTAPSPPGGAPGTLVWELHGGNFNESEALSFTYSTSSNVAVPEFMPSYSNVQVAFDKENKLNVPSYIDDCVVPPKEVLGSEYRWYVCTTLVTSYTYSTLAWVLGSHSPQNPSCVKVDVVRVFV